MIVQIGSRKLELKVLRASKNEPLFRANSFTGRTYRDSVITVFKTNLWILYTKLS